MDCGKRGDTVMPKKNIIGRYALFLIGLFIASMGVAFSTKAGLGTSPVASVPYSVFLVCPVLSLGCLILAFGIWIQLKGAVAMLPGEAMNRAISMVTGKRYENVKIFFDILYIAIAAIICLVFIGRLEGVREGSIFAAIAVGNIIKVYNRIYGKITERNLEHV